MKPTRVALHRDFEIAAVDPRLFSGFSEHVGRIIYEGIYDPASGHADEDGLRRDVMAAACGNSSSPRFAIRGEFFQRVSLAGWGGAAGGASEGVGAGV